MLVTNDNESISVWFFSVRLFYGDLDRRSLTPHSAATFRARYKAMPVASILQRSAFPSRISRLPVATSKSTFSRRTLSLTLRSVEVRCIVRHGLHSDGLDNDVVSITDYGKCMHQTVEGQLTSGAHAAGNPTTFAQTCSGVCYDDYVLGSGSNYDNAYFEVQSVRVFGTSSSVVVQAPSNGARHGPAGLLGLAGLTFVLVLFIAS